MLPPARCNYDALTLYRSPAVIDIGHARVLMMDTGEVRVNMNCIVTEVFAAAGVDNMWLFGSITSNLASISIPANEAFAWGEMDDWNTYQDPTRLDSQNMSILDTVCSDMLISGNINKKTDWFANTEQMATALSAMTEKFIKAKTKQGAIWHRVHGQNPYPSQAELASALQHLSALCSATTSALTTV